MDYCSRTHVSFVFAAISLDYHSYSYAPNAPAATLPSARVQPAAWPAGTPQPDPAD